MMAKHLLLRLPHMRQGLPGEEAPVGGLEVAAEEAALFGGLGWGDLRRGGAAGFPFCEARLSGWRTA